MIGLLLFGAFSGLQQFEGKAFVRRLATYPVAALVVPLVWTLRRRRPSYPYAADVLLTLPFLIDTAGNALDLYDMIEWWDDANHLVNRALLWCGRRGLSGPFRALDGVLAGGGIRRDYRDLVGDRGVSCLHQKLSRTRYRLFRHS